MEALSALVKDAEPDLLTGAAGLLFEEGRKREAAGLLTWAAPILPKSALLRTALGDALAASATKPARAPPSKRRSPYYPKMSRWTPAKRRARGTRSKKASRRCVSSR